MTMFARPWDHVLVLDSDGDPDHLPVLDPGHPPPDDERGWTWLYAMWTLGGACLYLGQTVDLPSRVRAHWRRTWGPDAWYVTLERVPTDEVDHTEALAIRQLAPAWNVSLGATREARNDAARWALHNSRGLA